MSTDKPWSDLTQKNTPIGTDKLAILDSEDTDPDSINKTILISSLPNDQSPWKQDINADSFGLYDFGYLIGKNSTVDHTIALPSAFIPLWLGNGEGIAWDINGGSGSGSDFIIISADSSDNIQFTFENNNEYHFGAAHADWNDNQLINTASIGIDTAVPDTVLTIDHSDPGFRTVHINASSEATFIAHAPNNASLLLINSEGTANQRILGINMKDDIGTIASLNDNFSSNVTFQFFDIGMSEVHFTQNVFLNGNDLLDLGSVGVGTTTPAQINVTPVYDLGAGAFVNIVNTTNAGFIAQSQLGGALYLVQTNGTVNERWFKEFHNNSETKFQSIRDDGTVLHTYFTFEHHPTNGEIIVGRPLNINSNDVGNAHDMALGTDTFDTVANGIGLNSSNALTLISPDVGAIAIQGDSTVGSESYDGPQLHFVDSTGLVLTNWVRELLHQNKFVWSSQTDQDTGTSIMEFDLSADTIKLFNTLDMNSTKITSVLDPTAAQDAATMNYVDTELLTWTADHDAATFDLNNAGVIYFVDPAVTSTDNFSIFKDSASVLKVNLTNNGHFIISEVLVDHYDFEDGQADFHDNLLTNIATPLADQDAATKKYVDDLSVGLIWHDPVEVATTANLTLSGEQTIDGVLTSTSRILVKNQTTGLEDGIYDTAAGAWTRATDMPNGFNAKHSTVYTEGGDAQSGTAYTVTTDPAIVNTNDLDWTEIFQTFTLDAGNGLSFSGNTLNVGSGNGIGTDATDVFVTFTGFTPDNTLDMNLEDIDSAGSITLGATASHLQFVDADVRIDRDNSDNLNIRTNTGTMNFILNSAIRAQMSSSTFSFDNLTSVSVRSGTQLYFDDGGNTYIEESSADVLDIVVGGVTMLSLDEETTGNIIAGADLDMSSFSINEASTGTTVGVINFTQFSTSLAWRNVGDDGNLTIDATSDILRCLGWAGMSMEKYTANTTGAQAFAVSGAGGGATGTLALAYQDSITFGVSRVTITTDQDGPDNYIDFEFGSSADNIRLQQSDGIYLNNLDLIGTRNIIHDLSTSGTDVDFGEDQLQQISIAANTTFTGTGYAIGKSKTIKITTDGTLRTLDFPAGWIFVGTKPTDQAASKEGILTLTCFTAAEAGVIAAYTVEA